MPLHMKLAGTIGLLGLLATPALANDTFDTAVTTGPTQAAGTWYTDRYAPGGFSSPDNFDGDNRLLQHIDAADGLNNRPGAYQFSFYNTQGRKLDLADGTQSVSIDLYIPAEWKVAGKSMAGLWGTGVDALGDISAYPTISFVSNGISGAFQGWDFTNGGNTPIFALTDSDYNKWYTLSYEIVGDQVKYGVNGFTQSQDAGGTVKFTNVMLQGYNTTAGVTYDIHWDNLESAVPEPATWAMMIGGFGLVGASLRRKRAAVSFA